MLAGQSGSKSRTMIKPEARADLRQFAQSRHFPFRHQLSADGFIVSIKIYGKNSRQC
jgi:hypothetical protein